LDVTLNASHLIYGVLTNAYGDLAHKDRQQNMFSNFMKVKLKQQVALPQEAPSQNMVLNAFKNEIIFASFDPIITIWDNLPIYTCILPLGLWLILLHPLYFAHNEFPPRLCRT